MQRQIRWKDKTEDGLKREVRVTLFARKFKWQFKYKGEERWDYDTPPTLDDWNALVDKIEARYNRKRCSYKDLELAQKERDLFIRQK